MNRLKELTLAVEHTNEQQLLEWVDIVCGVSITDVDVLDDRATYEDMILGVIRNENTDTLEELHTTLMAEGLI